MRHALPLTLLAILAACNSEKDDEQRDSGPGVVTNIIDQSVPDADDMPPPANRITPSERNPDITQQQPDPQDSDGLIPLSLRGQWAGVDARCGDRTDDLALDIDGDRLIFHESVGTIDRVERKSDAYVVRADFTGEGQSWTRKLTMRLSADGSILTVMNGDTTETRKRCQALSHRSAYR